MKQTILPLAIAALFVCSSIVSAQDVFDFSDPVESAKSPAVEEPVADQPGVESPAAAPATPSPVPVQIDPFSFEGFVLPAQPVEPGKNWVLIVCGHPGDEDHRTLFAESIELVYEGLTENCGFAPENIVVQFGSEIQPEDGPALASAKGEATQEELAAQVAELAKQVGPRDTLWTIVLGHAYYDGRNSFLNLPGSDVHQDDFASWFAGIRGRQVFLIGTSVSGYFVRPLSGENRYVITATPPDLEVNETIFHLALAEVLSEPPTMEDLDADADGQATLFDFYITLTRNIAQRYLDANLLATEHSVLDDNGDGRGLELQIDYLSVEQGGRERDDDAPLPTIRPNSDGFKSIEFDFSMFALAKPVPEEPAETEEPSEADVGDETAESPEEEATEEPTEAEESEADADPDPEASDTEPEGGEEPPVDESASAEDAMDE